VVPWFRERFTPAYGAQIDHFVECIQQDTPPLVGPVDARASLQISLAAVQSQREGRPIQVSEAQDLLAGSAPYDD
jgi:predicted dehydrogenase